MRMWKSSHSGRVLRLVLPCDPALASDRVRIAQVAASFRAAHPDGLIVSVTPETDELRTLGFEVVAARDLLPYPSFLSLWTKAYRMADALLKRAGPDLARAISPFYHGIADLALQALLVPATLQVLSGPVLLLPLPGAATWYDRLAVEVLPTPWWLHLRIIVRICRGLLRELRRRFSSDAPPSGPRPPAAGVLPAILIVVDDGVSGVNFPSAAAIVAELGRARRELVVLTSDPQIRAAFESMNVMVCFCGVPRLTAVRPAAFALWRAAARDIRRLRRDSACGVEERALAELVADRLLPFCVFGAQIETLLSRYHHRHGPIGAGLVVNEGKPAAVVALTWLAANGVPDVGYWPALLGVRPDCAFFPASQHLVYGDHLRDLMVAMGIDARAIEAVGSVNFDQAVGRNMELDVAYVRDRLLADRRPCQKLVVVATEALPNPFEEIGPVLEALSAMPEVEIVLKLHPADSAKLYGDQLAQRGLAGRVVIVERCDLDALLHAATLLVCVLSNIIVRAAILGTPTLVCDFGDKRRPLDFVTTGLAVGCFSPQQVAPMLADLIGDGPARERVVAQLKQAALRFCYRIDGKSAERVAARLLSLVPSPPEAMRHP